MNRTEQVINVLKELTDVSVITEEATLAKDLALDSLAMVTLLLDIEDNFEIELRESDMDPFKLKTVSDVIKLVERYYRGSI